MVALKIENESIPLHKNKKDIDKIKIAFRKAYDLYDQHYGAVTYEDWKQIADKCPDFKTTLEKNLYFAICETLEEESRKEDSL